MHACSRVAELCMSWDFRFESVYVFIYASKQWPSLKLCLSDGCCSRVLFWKRVNIVDRSTTRQYIHYIHT